MENQIALVEIYIHHMTGQNVKIIPPQSIEQLFKLQQAFEVAENWKKNNNAVIYITNES